MHMIWVDYIAITAGILMLALVMLQSSQDDIGSAFSGEKSELFKNQKTRGFDLFLMRATIIVAVVLVVSVVLSNNLPR